jgi:hypothetical protein
VKQRKLFNLTLLFILFASACNKREGNIILPGQENQSQLSLKVQDSFSLRMQTIYEDSLPGNGLSYMLLGAINDPILGYSSASIYADLSLIEPSSSFPTGAQADSAILFIPSVDGLNHYGNRNYPISLDIYPLSENISSTRVYYQTDTVSIDYGIQSVYEGPLNNRFTDSVRYRKLKLRPYNGLRVKLSKDFAQKLMSMPKEAYETNEGLDKHFKGLALVPKFPQNIQSGEGCFTVFDLNNVISLDYRAKIMLYYGDSNTFVFGFSGKNQTVNHGKTGPYPAPVKAQLDQPDSSFMVTYAQALNGVKTRIQLPNLLDLLDNKNVAVNHAYIEFSIKNYDEYFFAPPRLNLFRPANENSRRNFLIEDAASLSNYGGIYNAQKGTYKFIITRHIQNLLNRQHFNGIDRNWGLFLAIPTDQPVIGARCVIDHSKTLLHITYTKPN